MDPFEDNTHSFIVKIWLEEAEEEGGRPVWRGHITHVPSKRRRYISDMGDVTSFIASYLEQMGIKKVEERWRGVRGWLSKRHT